VSHIDLFNVDATVAELKQAYTGLLTVGADLQVPKYSDPWALAGLGHGRPCWATDGSGGFSPISGSSGPMASASGSGQRP
jgi:hypothetical protein